MNFLDKLSLAAIGITICAVTYDDVAKDVSDTFKELFEANASTFENISLRAKPKHSVHICEHDDINHENCVDTVEIALGVLKNRQSPIRKMTHKDLFCLAQNIYFEARGEGIDGMTAVGEITLNRVDSPDFPDNVCDVVFEKKRKNGKWIPQMEWTVENNKPVPRSKPISNKDYYMNIASKIASGVYDTGHGDSCHATFWVNPSKMEPQERTKNWHAKKYFSNKINCSFKVNEHVFFNYEV